MLDSYIRRVVATSFLKKALPLTFTKKEFNSKREEIATLISKKNTIWWDRLSSTPIGLNTLRDYNFVSVVKQENGQNYYTFTKAFDVYCEKIKSI